MLEWFAERVPTYRQRGIAWRVWAAVLVAIAIAVAVAVIWWRRSTAARIAHEAYVAQLEARKASDAARVAADNERVTELRERADEAQARADAAHERAQEAQAAHVEALDAIDRVRSWDDVRPRR